MREIKFRAWDKENKTMIYPKEKENDKTALITLNAWCDTENERSILMQFTGFKDTYRTEKYPDGQEIYEGDIVMSECFKRFPDGSAQLRKYINVIDWYEGVKISGWRIKGKGFQTTLKKSTIGNMKLVVIGNVFQNPELL